MRGVFFAALALCISCGPPVIQRNSCCQPVTIQRNFGYATSYESDGGVTTQVQVIVGTNGLATVTFVRGADQIVERFQATSR